MTATSCFTFTVKHDPTSARGKHATEASLARIGTGSTSTSAGSGGTLMSLLGNTWAARTGKTLADLDACEMWPGAMRLSDSIRWLLECASDMLDCWRSPCTLR